MPLFLVPPPQRIQTTRRDFTPSPESLVRVDAVVGGDAEPALAALRERIPDLQVTSTPDAAAAILFEPLAGATSDAVVRLEVGEESLRVAASGRPGWLRAATLLRQLSEEEAIVGVTIEDWPTFPTREFHLPFPFATLTYGYWGQLLATLAEFGFNQVSFLGSGSEQAAPEIVAAEAKRLCIRLLERAEPPAGAVALLEGDEIGFVRQATLDDLPRQAVALLETGAGEWIVSAEGLDEASLLGGLLPGLCLAGACGWNPRKAEYRAVRRTFARRMFGPEATAIDTVLQAMETVGEIGDGLLERRPTGAPFARLFAEAPFRPVLRHEALRLLQRAREAMSEGTRALDAFETVRDVASRNGTILATLEWPLRRLVLETEHVLALDRIRAGYAEAFASDSAARAATQRVRGAAEALGALANQVAAVKGHLESIWPQERAGPPAPVTVARLAARIEQLRGKAEELRGLRDRYLQSGVLPTPEAMGLDRRGERWTRSLLPGRLPSEPSPSWWPEGGFARVRMDVEATHDAMPWEVLVNFRALSGETGTFAVGGAQLLPYDLDRGTVGEPVPCQLTRGGLVFVAEAGNHSYYLYLDVRGEERRAPVGWVASAERARARSPREGIVLENARLSLQLNPLTGAIRAWRYRDGSDREWMEPPSHDGGSDALFMLVDDDTAELARARVIEHGPVLVRAQVEYGSGRIRQYDLYAGMPWCEFATNPPVREVVASLAVSDAMDAEVARCALKDGWIAALSSSDDGVRHQSTPAGCRTEGRPHLSRLLLWCGSASDGAAPVRTLAAMRQPPVVRLGVVEERRAREF